MPATQVRKRRPGRPKIDEPSPVDVHVCARVRQRHTSLGMSQEKLGRALRLTFQQVQKYERGSNRISASNYFSRARSRMYRFLCSLTKWPSQQTTANGSRALQESLPSEVDVDVINRRETLELVRAYYLIHDGPARRKLHDLVRAAAN